MTTPKTLKLCALAFLLLASVAGYSQCSGTFKTSHHSKNGKGQIEIVVKSDDSYVVELISNMGIERKVIQTKRGSGNGKYAFNDLPLNGSYQVLVSFPSQKEFLCKKKYSEDIFFEIN